MGRVVESLRGAEDENLHAPNEFFRLDRLEEGMAAWARLWRLLAAAA